MIKHAINKTTNEEYKVLISLTKFNAKQSDMIRRIIAFYDNIDANMKALQAKFAHVQVTDEDKKRYAQKIYRRSEIYHASVLVDKDRHCAVYYVTKNNALKRADHMYDLKRCKLTDDETTSASEAKQTSEAKQSKREAKQSKKALEAVTSEAKQLTSAETSNALALLTSASETSETK